MAQFLVADMTDYRLNFGSPCGTITPPGDYDPSIPDGSQRTFTIVPYTNYYIKSIIWEPSYGNAGSAQDMGTVSPVTVTAYGSWILRVTFDVITHTISSSTGPNGTVDRVTFGGTHYRAPETYTATQLTSYDYYAIADAGYKIKSLLVDGAPISAAVGNTSYKYTLSAYTNHTISATFELQSRAILATAYNGGTVNPSGTVNLIYGGDQTFTITPNSGFKIDRVMANGINQGAISTFTFTNVTVFTDTLEAYFSPSITASTSSNGAISAPGVTYYQNYTDATYTFTPNAGYKVAQIVVDGINRGTGSSYVFSMVSSPHTISVTFTPVTNLIYAIGYNGGTVVPGNTDVELGQSQTFTITPVRNFVISQVQVDNVNQGPISSYTFTNVTKSHSIAAWFASRYCTITATAVGSGYISPSGAASVIAGSSKTYTFTPNTSQYVGRVTVDGVDQGTIGSYTFTDVQTDHTITATFALKTFNLTASAGANGTISPSGIVNKTAGNAQVYTITPASGYAVASVIVDGVSAGAVTTYPFYNIMADHTISATFVLCYNITATAGPGGSSSPSGSVSVNTGSNKSYSITPSYGYAIADVLVDGGSVGAVSSYTFSNVTGDHTISASFSQIISTITASAGVGGTVSPSGFISVNYAANQTVAIAASSGYTIGDVLVDGASQGKVSTYTFTAVVVDHSITASFLATAAPDPVPAPTPTPDPIPPAPPTPPTPPPPPPGIIGGSVDEVVIPPPEIIDTFQQDDTIYRRALTALCTAGPEFLNNVREVVDNQYSHSFRRETESYIWRAEYVVIPQRETVVQAGGSILRRAASEWDFLNTSDPTWMPASYVEVQSGIPELQNKYVYMRNIEVVTTSVPCTAGSDIEIADLDQFHLDTPIWHKVPYPYNKSLPQQMQWIKIDTSDVIWGDTKVSVRLPYGEEITSIVMRYRNKTVFDSLQDAYATVNGFEVPIRLLPFHNNLDDIAQTFAVTRGAAESNASLASRLRDNSIITNLDGRRAPAFSVANDLGLVSLKTWAVTASGETADYLDLEELGLLDVTDVWLPDLPLTQSYSETLIQDRSYEYGSDPLDAKLVVLPGHFVIPGKRIVEPGYNIHVDGIRLANTTNVTVTDGLVVFPVTSVVSATLSYEARNYIIERNLDGTVRRISSIPHNTPRGTYLVVCISDVKVWEPTDQDTTIEQKQVIAQLATSVKKSAPVVLGSACWDSRAVWFDENAPAPAISYTPILLDGSG